MCIHSQQVQRITRREERSRVRNVVALFLNRFQDLISPEGASTHGQISLSRNLRRNAHFAVTFPLFAKIDVNGHNAHPLYRFLKSAKRGLLGRRKIAWNFTKFLLDREGSVRRRYGPLRKPEQIEKDVSALV